VVCDFLTRLLLLRPPHPPLLTKNCESHFCQLVFTWEQSAKGGVMQNSTHKAYFNFGGSHEQIEDVSFPTSSYEFHPPPARPPAQARPQVHIVGPRQRHHLKKGCSPMGRSEHLFSDDLRLFATLRYLDESAQLGRVWRSGLKRIAGKRPASSVWRIEYMSSY
jgi:hypothetical protein